MPNCCMNKCAFFTNSDSEKNKKEIARLYKALAGIMEKPLEASNDFEPGCLREVAIAHGIDWEKIRCRGSIEILGEFEPGDMSFVIETDTAWSPTTELWDAVIEQYEDISYVYICEEPGMGIFVNTDTEGRFFVDRYLLEIWGDAPIPDGWYAGRDKPSCLEIREYFECFDKLYEFCKGVMGREFDTFDELTEYLDELFGDVDNTCANVYEFEEE